MAASCKECNIKVFFIQTKKRNQSLYSLLFEKPGKVNVKSRDYIAPISEHQKYEILKLFSTSFTTSVAKINIL